MSSIKPVGDRILIKPVIEDEITKSGIVLPDTVDKEKKAEGEILAIGGGEEVTKLELQVGNRVLFGKYSGEEIKVGPEELRILNHDDILAVVE
jgi:chaperonin GroES